MDTVTLMKKLHVIERKCKRLYKGKFYFNVIPCDYLDKIEVSRYRKLFLIVNTDSSKNAGEHWLGLGIFYEPRSKKNICLYFDSYGFSPSINHIKKFIGNKCDKTIFNTKKIQGPFSLNCGLYSICFLYNFIKNNKMSDFTKKFVDKDYKKNDEKIERMYKRIFKSQHKKSTRKKNQHGGVYSVVCNQTCKSFIECKRNYANCKK